MSIIPTRSRVARTALVAVSALALVGSSVAASAAQAGTRSATHANYYRACAVNHTPGIMSCFALIRSDIKQRTESAIGHDSAPVGDGYGPSSLQSAYNLTSDSASGGAGESVAVVDAYNDPNAVSDLATYRSAWGLAACNSTTGAGCLSVVNQKGAASPLPANAGDTGWDVEESLDVDMVSAICPKCKIYLVEASAPSIADLGTSVNSAVKLGAKFVSNSYGGSQSTSDGTYDTKYYQHAGDAIVASAGDDGYGVSYPAASRYVTSVGGTSLVQATGTSRGWTETVWSGTGGGCATKSEARPSWQKFSVTGCANRLDNDVAAVADPDTGVAIYDTYSEGGWLEVGGTSVASPIIGSVYALANNLVAGKYPSHDSYSHTGDLNDVTVGSNGTCRKTLWCNAGPGYDGPTGNGTPNGTGAF